VVDDEDTAMRALEALKLHKDRVHAWDTETYDLLLGRSKKARSPVTHGKIVCATCFCGDDVDFGNGPRLYIDNLDDAEGILLNFFKEYFEDESYRKVFHNYSFDRHMFRREGIKLKGFLADTLHLARLNDTSLGGWEGDAQKPFLLEQQAKLRQASAGNEKSEKSEIRKKPTLRIGGRALSGADVDYSIISPMLKAEEEERQKQAQKEAQQRAYRSGGRGIGYSLKSLTKLYGLDTDEQPTFMQAFGATPDAAADAARSPEYFEKFALYSARDAELTYKLFQFLKSRLEREPWRTPVHPKRYRKPQPYLYRYAKATPSRKHRHMPLPPLEREEKTLWDLVQEYYCDIGDCLADMEEVGVGVSVNDLDRIEKQLEKDIEHWENEFAEKIKDIRGPRGLPVANLPQHMNPRSSAQRQVLLFGGATKINKMNNEDDETIEESREVLCEGELLILQSMGLTPGNTSKDRSKVTGAPKTDRNVFEKLVSSPCGKQGTAFPQLIAKGYREDEAIRACQALWALNKRAVLKNMLSNSVQPLKEKALESSSSRVHSGWVLDTATGRLASRQPNLQNLPREDSAGVRASIKPLPGCSLIILDYSQLELRVLAHVSQCQSMADRLSMGGDYHSEVAVEMFDELKRAVANGEVVTSRSDDKPGVPTVKDKFPHLRSQAKAINFGIVYGKTARTLAEDLLITEAEAECLIEKWFKTKPGVEKWITKQREDGQRDKKVFSLFGRPRHQPFLAEEAPLDLQRRSMRAATNFGIQGSAADIVTLAMLQIWKDETLKKLGFKLVMQVHDEFVLEGPTKHAKKAGEIVVKIMKSPFAKHNKYYQMTPVLEVDWAIAQSLAEKP